MHLKDGSSKHGTVSVCPRRGRVCRPGRRQTRHRTCDSAADSSESVRQTAAESCSTENMSTT